MLKLESVAASGGLVVDESDRILFLFKDGRWDFPKGLLDDNDLEAGENALKEVAEESGIPIKHLERVSELIPTSHISKFKKRKYLKTTRWFLIRCKGRDITFKPQKSEGIEHCAWFAQWDLDRPLANCPSRIRYLVHFWLKAKKAIR